MDLKVFKGYERFTDGYPSEAIKYALKHREEVTPELLETLEYTISNAESLSQDSTYLIQIVAMYILAYFRETKAYTGIIRIASLPGEQVFDLMGDIVIDDLKRIIASVCDGNIKPIKAIIENSLFDEYVRAEALEALLILLNHDVISREELVFYFKELFNGKLEADQSAVWDILPRLCSLIHPSGLKGDIEKAVADRKVIELIADLDFMNRQLERPVREVLDELKQDEDYSYISKEDVYFLEGWVEEFLWLTSDEYVEGFEDVDDVMEEWDDELDFYKENDWKGLVERRSRIAERHPYDPDCQWALGEAYVLNSEYEKAINLLSKLHMEYPDDPNIQRILLDALYAAGKDETAVRWLIKPKIIRLDQSALDYCYNFMRKKRKPRSVYELRLEFFGEGYPGFTDEQLMALLKSDNRFLLTGSSAESHNCFVSVNRE